MKGHRVVTLGEIMLRLKSPGFERLFQSPLLEATFGGGEANVAANLALFGIDSAFVTILPIGPIGDACIQFLRGLGVDTTWIVRTQGRMGIYFFEAGAAQRPSQVVYDRANSTIANASPSFFDWQTIFRDADWFHISGITPALSPASAELAMEAVQAAKQFGITVSCDYNYRAKLWSWGKKAPAVMQEIVKYVDIGMANEEDIQKALGITSGNGDWEEEITSGALNPEKYRRLCEEVFLRFPNLKMQAITLRQSYNANHNGWEACLYNGKDFFLGRQYDISNIVDRVGTGDAFAAGLIASLIQGLSESDALEFATASSCLKHSIPGDMNLLRFDEVKRLLEGDASGRVQR